jgi:hypothetical protein
MMDAAAADLRMTCRLGCVETWVHQVQSEWHEGCNQARSRDVETIVEAFQNIVG